MAMDLADAFTAQSILDDFAELPDPRSHINRAHLLGDMIVISIMATIAGADGPKAIGLWAKAHADWLREHLDLPAGIPSHDTIGRVLLLLKPDAFQACFQRWIERVIAAKAVGTGKNIIAIDGKALRRSHDRRKELGPLFLVSAWAVKQGVSLGQLATEEKSNEITAIPELIDQIEVKGAVVTIDAAGCQRAIAAKIIDKKGDYCLALKGNQATLHTEAVNYIAKHAKNRFTKVKSRKYVEDRKGHGREERVTYIQLEVPDDFPNRENWKGIKTLGVAVRYATIGEKEAEEVRYYISSLPLSVKQFAACVRGHWAIENTLHWCLDVTFREDESRVRDRTLADNLAWLKRFTIGLLKQVADKESIVMRRRMAGWNCDYLAKVLGLSRT